MQAVIICNPAAGAGRARAQMERLRPQIHQWPWSTRVDWTEGPGGAMALAEQAVSEGVGVLVAAGGDGTVHEVVNGLLREDLDSGPALGYLPLGSGCDFARALGLSDAATVAADLPTYEVRSIDLGVMEIGNGRERQAAEAFVNGFNIGLAPGVLARLRGSRLLRRLGPASYGVAAALEAFSMRPIALEVSVDEQLWGRGPVLSLSVCNGPFFGGGLRPCVDASLSNGRLDLAWVGELPTLQALRALGRAKRGLEMRHRAVRLGAGRSVEVVGGPARLEVDGEMRLWRRLRARVLPGALRVLSPPAAKPVRHSNRQTSV